ncbi:MULTISPECIES: CFI-box-CTERM domain-containing protein [unclassified Flavobacterium]|uniref:CFI-box-CTERM domain-containing protein n=1 Tax=unclassified Flavobacterium TaxID=196869 RepID=UPI0025BFD787|nr:MULTISPECIES: CFI-box-CTERM domain-containing protein [unclassified Flavobacterium]
MHKLTSRQEAILSDTRKIFEKNTDVEFIKKRKRFLNQIFPNIEELYKNNPNEFEEISTGIYSIMYNQEVKYITSLLKTKDYKSLQEYKKELGTFGRIKYLELENSGKSRLCQFLIEYEDLIKDWMDSENGSRAILKEVNKDDGYCYVATMVYGDYNHPNVIQLRNYRDNKLNKYELGRAFISYYYKYSPYWVKRMKNCSLINKLLKISIDLIVSKIK